MRRDNRAPARPWFFLALIIRVPQLNRDPQDCLILEFIFEFYNVYVAKYLVLWFLFYNLI